MTVRSGPRRDKALTPADLAWTRHGTEPRPGSLPSPSPVATPGEAGDPTKRRTVLALIGGAGATPLTTPGTASADAARASAQHATLTGLDPTDIEGLETAVRSLSATYSSQPPRELWPEAARERRRAFTLLQGRRHTLREARDLARHAGMLSVILAWAAHDLGKDDLVEAYCDDAWVQGRQADLPEVSAWAEDVRSTHALYGNRPLDALTAATRGLAIAPQDSNAAVRLSAQVARAQARLGHREEFRQAAVRAHEYQTRLPLHGAGLFGVDAVRIISYDASSYVWLGQAQQARTVAEEAIGHYRSCPRPLQAPTRLAIAQLDLAQAHSALGDPDAAIAAARQALASGRLVDSIRVRAQQLDRTLRHRYPREPAVAAFAEEVRLLLAA
ncbi:XRE family transcriptional regulator [Streptomyces albogriseolus]|uniref:XRE family transcriptional regulator n=1 Tax=Streptomyces albogriseolus TaxID=1887 RepID=UPI0019B7AE80|nr:XRE family transcriptional regulator [Streptomyces sp.]